MNILNRPSFKSQNGYSGFDLSHKKFFSSTCGELLPIYFDILQPGDKVAIKTELRTRTQPLLAPTVALIKEHVEWFFVPLEQIYSFFGSWYFGIDNYKSSLGSLRDISNLLPHIASSDMKNWYQSQAGDVGNPFDASSTTVRGMNIRLLDILGLNGTTYGSVVQGSDTIAHLFAICPIILCAYQKIWNDYFRVSDYISADPSSYNLDKWYDSPSIPVEDAISMSTLRYRPRQKDYFTNIYRSPVFSDTSLGSLDGFGTSTHLQASFQQWLMNDISFKAVNPAGSTSPTPTYITPGSNNIKYVSPTSIRTSFAVEKLLEITRRAGKTYDAQTLAHFGVKSHSDLGADCLLLSRQTSTINIGDVISTSYSPENQTLGELAGKGYGYSDGSSFKYEASKHGILMCLYSCEPTYAYDNNRVNRMHLMASRDSWFSPEYDNLGMQPLFYYECRTSKTTSSSNFSTIMGWQYRYMELKARFNEIHGSYCKLNSDSYWINHYNFSPNWQNDDRSIMKYFYVQPTDLDGLFESNFTFNPSDSSYPYISEPLLHEVYFDSKKSSKMSAYGLEQL